MEIAPGQRESKYKDSLDWKVRVKFFLLGYRDGLKKDQELKQEPSDFSQVTRPESVLERLPC